MRSLLRPVGAASLAALLVVACSAPAQAPDVATPSAAPSSEGPGAGAGPTSGLPPLPPAPDVAPPAVSGTADVRDGAVRADLTYVLEAPADGTLVLRLLPAASQLGDVGLEIALSIDGIAVRPEIDRDGALLRALVPLRAAEDGILLVELRLRYEVADRATLPDDGSPAGGGLLSRTGPRTVLGHWLPLPTFDPSPMVPAGDVGAFPVARFDLEIEHDGVLVAGGQEAPCAQPRPTCTAIHETTLRDVAAVVLPAGAEAVEGGAATGTVAAVWPSGGGGGAVRDEAVAMLDALADSFGTLPWGEVDIVEVPMGAAGMEFPGIVLIDPESFGAGGGWPSFVTAHEVGHQWFHALLGNPSLTSPVVDESLAQYAGYLAFAALFGQGAADDIAQRQLGGRWERAGRPSDPATLPVAGFSSERAYGAVVYGRAGQAWVDAERELGRDQVVGFLRAFVDAHRLGVVDAEALLAAADDWDPALGSLLRAGWGVG